MSEIEKAKSEIEKTKSEIEKVKSEIDKAKSEIKKVKSEIKKVKSEIENNIKTYNLLPQRSLTIIVPQFTKNGINQFRNNIDELMKEELSYNKDASDDPDSIDPDEFHYLRVVVVMCENLIWYMEKYNELEEELKDLEHKSYLK